LSGAWNAPKKQRLYSGLCHVRNRAPYLGGNFGLWGGIFSSVECLLIHYRQIDDKYNTVAAGFITGGVLAIRGGASQAFKQALLGGMILTIIEGVSTLMTAIF
jgi:import inner membrane translocase subunit TIM17